MTRGAGYKRLGPSSFGSQICAVHGLLRYPEVVAKIDAEKLRRESEPGTPGALAVANQCGKNPGMGWHIYLPTNNRMKTLRRRDRKKGEVS